MFFLLVGVFSLSVGLFSLCWAIFSLLGIFSCQHLSMFSICWYIFFSWGMFSIFWGVFSICWGVFSICRAIFSVWECFLSLWVRFLTVGAFLSRFPLLEHQGSPCLSQEGADVSSISCKQSDGGGSALVQLEELCRTLMGRCSLEVLMNNGGKAAPGGVQSPSPFGMSFPSSLGIPGGFLRTLKVKGTVNNISSSAWAWWAAPVEFQPGEGWQGFLKKPQKFHRAKKPWIFQDPL